MLRSLYAGVSGLQNHQVRMDVIGNNISNVNTIGFKKGRVNFQDMLSQTMAGAASPSETKGGINPKQVGLGMMIASIDTIHTQGNLQTTGVATDLAIQGNGFFILKDGEATFYTRAGAFNIDKDGILVNPANGLKVQGWLSEVIDGQSFINSAADPTDIPLPIGSKDPAAATTEVKFACNLDKRTAEIPPGAGPQDIQAGTWSVDKTVYDSFGSKHNLRLNFTKIPGTQNQWQAAVLVDPDEAGANVTNSLINIGGGANAANTFNLEFDNLGRLLSATDGEGDLINAGNLQVNVAFDVAGATVPPGAAAVRQNINLNLGEVGSTENTITQFAETSSTKAFEQNGYTMGYFEGFRIDPTGTIIGIYTNGTKRAIGQIALASFRNPGGLEKAGESSYVVTNNSGEAQVGPSGIAGLGSFVSGALEMSNVDLAEQFTDMIVTQRGFQANSKTITTSDQMLQELLTLKR